VFNQCWQSNKTRKGLGVHKNDTSVISVWDIPLALVLLTRLPVPKLPEGVFARQASAVWAFPLVGLVVGALACAAGWGAMLVGLSPVISATLAVAVLIAATGAMHEDGLADTFDGLWGGFTVERRLEIMKDSQIGTYGVLALVVSQLLRVLAISALLGAGWLSGILAACVFSRALMPCLMRALPNARKSGLSQSVGVPSLAAVFIGLGLAVGLALVLQGANALVPMICAGLGAIAVATIAKARIRGQTGDILGATQAISEVAFLLALAAQL